RRANRNPQGWRIFAATRRPRALRKMVRSPHRAGTRRDPSTPRSAHKKARHMTEPARDDGILNYARKKVDDDKRRQGGNGAAPLLLRINLPRYDSEPIPAREWGVPDRFPRRAVCLLSGEGGRGKSIILLQLAAAHVLGKDWLRSLPESGPVALVN